MITIAAFLVAVSLLTSAAAWMGEEGVRGLGGSMRWVWLAAMAAGPLLLAGSFVIPEAPAALATAPIAPIELPPLVVGSESPNYALLNDLFGGLWLLLSAGLAAVLLWTSLGLNRARRGWERTEVLGRPVYISSARGPAVAGFLRPWIVLPRWVLALPESDLGLVVLHEEEHVRAGDSLLLGAALGLVIVAPWNPITWWQLRRLRGAMELDCDKRVLRREPDRERYGRSLLSVAERSTGPWLGLAAFTERPLSLERRIIAMTWKNSRWTPVKAGLLTLLAMVVAVQACGVAIPLVDDAPDAAQDPYTDIQADELPTIEIPPPAASGAAEPDQAFGTEADGATEPSGAAGATEPDRAFGADEPDPATVMSRNDVDAESSLPSQAREELAQTPTFTPFTVAPSIRNREEVIAAMEAEYPPLLRDAGIGGTVRVYFFINEDGVAEDVRIDQTSGHQALDDAAIAVANVYRFSPALNRDQRVPVWVSFPITFQVR